MTSSASHPEHERVSLKEESRTKYGVGGNP